MANARTFREMRTAFLADGFGAIHMLKPVVDELPEAFLAIGNHDEMQSRWAREAGMPDTSSKEDILLAQIEDHRTEIFYNMDPISYGNAFLGRLPGSVRKTIAWRAAPSPHTSFLEHDLIVNNYPALAAQYRAMGARTAYFFPAHDPAMDVHATNGDRPIDILFVGGYSRHHRVRAAMLEAVSDLATRYEIAFHLDVSRMTRLAETPLGWAGPLRSLRRPPSIRAIACPPIFGRDMYSAIGGAKVVINGKVDIAGDDRGNMRVWETMGCGAALVSDAGNYPEGMVSGETLLTYESAGDLVAAIEQLLEHPKMRVDIAQRGYEMISTRYSRDVQWQAFVDLTQ